MLLSAFAKGTSPNEERLLDDFLPGALDRAGRPGHVVFENPNAIVVIETVGPRAGDTLWKREDMDRYPFLRLDWKSEKQRT